MSGDRMYDVECIYSKGEEMESIILDSIEKYSELTIKLRKHFHENPELSGKEFQTSDYIKNYAEKLNYKIKPMTTTGFIAILETGRSGRTIGIRAELDALPIKENPYNLTMRKNVLSKNKEAMHACGHDGHLAISMTVMKILSDNQDHLTGRVTFIFEEAEEIGGSINELIPKLKPYQFDAVYGNHLYSDLETGKVAINKGPVMAGSAKLSFKIKGKGGHASRPDQTINPIFVGTSIINNIGLAWNYQRKVTETVTLGFSVFNSGTTWNIISDEALIEGTLRFFDMDEGNHALKIIKDISESVAKSSGAEVIFSEDANKAFAPTINDIYLASLCRNIVLESMKNIQLEDVTWFASETFADYHLLGPTVFTLIGTKNLDKGVGASHHNEKFDLDEDSLFIAIELMLRFAFHSLMREF